MVYRGCAGVEQHGDRTDKLRDEDGEDGLPVVEAYAYQTRAKSPVAKRQGKVEDDIVVPYMSIRQPYSGLSKGYLHLHVRFSGGVGSRSSFDHVGPVSPCEWRSSTVSGTRTHCLKLSQLLKALIAFFFFSMAVAFAVWKVMVGRSLGGCPGSGLIGASRPLSVQRALSDSDRDSGDETEGGERRREKSIRQKHKTGLERA